MTDQATNNSESSLRRTLLTIGAILLIILVAAISVQSTEINLEKPLDPARQERLVRVLRQLANPEFISVDRATGQISISETTVITIERIIETILMALIASTVGTLLAMPISFFAARNLMESITAPLASIMAAVIGILIGGAIGWIISVGLVNASVQLSSNFLIGLIVLIVSGAIVYALQRVGPPAYGEGGLSPGKRILTFLRVALIVLLLIFGLGLLGNLGKTLGIFLQDALGCRNAIGGIFGAIPILGSWMERTLDCLGFVGNFVFVLSDLLLLLLPATAALIAGLSLGSLASRLGQEAVLQFSGLPARLLTGLLTGFGTAILLLSVIYFLNWLYQYDSPTFRTLRTVALAAALVAGVLSLTLKPKRPFQIGFAIYTVTRGILNILRSIEPLIMGIVFVVWVSLGPFAGIMALTLHSIAALGKLFSEQVEGISEGPVEAVTATGANRIQTVVFAVIPQIIPPFTAFALYRWDINVRMSTIIGFVGGGGIGFVLSQNIQKTNFRAASVMMLAIALVVATLDYASSKIRQRII